MEIQYFWSFVSTSLSSDILVMTKYPLTQKHIRTGNSLACIWCSLQCLIMWSIRILWQSCSVHMRNISVHCTILGKIVRFEMIPCIVWMKVLFTAWDGITRRNSTPWHPEYNLEHLHYLKNSWTFRIRPKTKEIFTNSFQQLQIFLVKIQTASKPVMRSRYVSRRRGRAGYPEVQARP